MKLDAIRFALELKGLVDENERRLLAGLIFWAHRKNKIGLWDLRTVNIFTESHKILCKKGKQTGWWTNEYHDWYQFCCDSSDNPLSYTFYFRDDSEITRITRSFAGSVEERILYEAKTA